MPRHPILPTSFDDVSTATSVSQVSTEIDISGHLLPWLDINYDKNKQGASVLLCRPKHIAYLYSHLARLPGSFVALDASRGWIMYWIVGSLATLGVQVKEEERLDAINTLLSFQHPQGGFGGGPGQLGHLASTYSSICAIATLLDGADQSLIHRTWARVDVKKMYQWILSLKQPDGSFAMHRHGETDVRGCYAALVVATALNLLTPELVENVPQYIVSSQTYEGGMSSTSISTTFYDQNEGGIANQDCPRATPIGEAHGGYTSCALAAYFLLQGLPSLQDSPKLNYQSCLRWTSQMQGLPIEGGGFRGRTNKLVDGCYSWWCGGTFPLLKAFLSSDFPDQLESMDLFDRQALQEYILLISQDLALENSQGGLRDKPAASPDLYHTHYILSGLSTAQHSQRYCYQRIREIKEGFNSYFFGMYYGRFRI